MKKTIEEVLFKATEGVSKMGSISQPKLQVLASTFPIPENAGEVKEALERHINTMKTPHEQCAEEIGNGFTEYVRHDKDFTDEDIVKILSKHFPQPPTSTPSLDEVAEKWARIVNTWAQENESLKSDDALERDFKQAILEYNASLVAEVGRLVERVKSEEARANGLGNRIAKEKAEADRKRISKERDELRGLCDKLHEANHELVIKRDQIRTQLATIKTEHNLAYDAAIQKAATAEQTGYERGVREAAGMIQPLKYRGLFEMRNAILNLLNKKGT